jgi:tetratricopeptide (TPR) repeat protein
MEDILAVQTEIARSIVGNIQTQLSPQSRAQLNSDRGGINPNAFDAYVKGRYFLNKRIEGDLKKAIENFHLALDVNPNYAAAYAGLADTYAQLGYTNISDPMDAFPKAKAAALKALELDSNLAEAHAIYTCTTTGNFLRRK